MLKHIFAFEKEEDFQEYKYLIERFSKKIKDYQLELVNHYELKEVPKGVVWTTDELATTVFSNIPIPAFTNKDLIYLSPDLVSWRRLFLTQLEGKKHSKIEDFYTNMSENHILTILGHELTHHSDLFLDEFDDERENSIWFEEGMCEYLSRKYLLNDTEYKEITNIEIELMSLFKHKYGNHSLEEFGSDSYQGSLTSIMFDYWRSFLAVKYLVEEVANNDPKQVFKEYHKWHNEGRKKPLIEYFHLDNLF